MLAFRKAVLNDVSKILEIDTQAFAHPFKMNDYIYEISSNEFSTILLIENDGETIGFIDYWITFDSATICRLAIVQKFRNKGYATMLIDKMIEICRENEVQTITLEVRSSNIAAINLYKKEGFVYITTKKSYYEDGEDAEYMIKGV